MSGDKAIEAVFKELRASEKQHPGWPKNIFEQLAIIGEEFGELQQAALQAKHDRKPKENIYMEAVQLAAMSIRFLLNWEGPCRAQK